jgi:MFS family permease
VTTSLPLPAALRGFRLLMSAQFVSGLADNALLLVAIGRLAAEGGPVWLPPLLKLAFTLAYVLLAPFVGPLADRAPKAAVMSAANALKAGACAAMALGAPVGLLLLPMPHIDHWLPALPLLACAGLVAGLFVVPMNALLQHRGATLLSAGRSIAVQNFNENASVLLMLAGYAWFSRQDLPLELLIRGFGLGIALLMALIALHHRHHHRHHRQAHRHKEIA